MLGLFSSFVLIFIAELGDKTQLLTFGFASKYSPWKVVSAVFCATAILMAFAVLFGGAISSLVPAFYMKLFTGIIFIAFGLWVFFEREKGEEEGGEGKRKRMREDEGGKNIFLVIFSAFFLAELGDKTQLATFVLATKYGAPIFVWIGATLGMVCANILAIIAGSWIGKHVLEKYVKWAGGLLFIGFGIATLTELLL